MAITDHAPTLAGLVLEQPEAAALFERLGLDYCCGGRQTLAEACARRGLDAHTVEALLDGLREDPRRRPEVHDVARSSLADLCDHIVARHHEPLRGELTRISDLLATVVRVHGRDHRQLQDLQRLFAGTRAELERHMRAEEESLFPACRALDGEPGAPARFDAAGIAMLEDDHEATGDALVALRELAGGYRTEAALCGTHRALLRALHGFELDMHQHVHEENNVLFPRVRGRVDPGPRAA